MQAITTRFFGPTNHRGSRYKATCDAGSLTLQSDDRHGSEGNHVRVAHALIAKLGWFHDGSARPDRYGDWFYGGTPEGYTFVCACSHVRMTPDGVNHVYCPKGCHYDSGLGYRVTGPHGGGQVLRCACDRD